MSGRPARHTEAEIKRTVKGAIRGILEAGLPVAGVRLDGAVVTILTQAQADAAMLDIEAETTDDAALRRIKELYGSDNG
jgi:hypothetical protein